MSTVEFDESSTSDLGDPGAAKVETADAADQPAKPAAVPAAKLGQIYTVMAREGVNAAQLINTAMRKRSLGKLVPRRIEVISPHGPSTSGGKMARQSITLAPASGQGAAIVCGFLDVAQKRAELRDYAFVAHQHQARFGSPFEASAEEYQVLSKELANLLGTLGFQIAAAHEEEAEPAAHGESELPGTSNRMLVLVAVGVAAALAIVTLLLLN